MNSVWDIVKSDKLTLVDFYADRCEPCKLQVSVLDELEGLIGSKAQVLKVNVDINKAASQAYGIRSIPTLMLFKNGRILWRHMGFAPLNDLFDVLNYHSSNN